MKRISITTWLEAGTPAANIKAKMIWDRLTPIQKTWFEPPAAKTSELLGIAITEENVLELNLASGLVKCPPIRQPPLEQLKSWLCAGLPDVDHFEMVARMLTEEEEQEFLRFGEEHVKTYGSELGALEGFPGPRESPFRLTTPSLEPSIESVSELKFGDLFRFAGELHCVVSVDVSEGGEPSATVWTITETGGLGRLAFLLPCAITPMGMVTKLIYELDLS